MTAIVVEIPDALAETAAAQAERFGLSHEAYIRATVEGRVAAQEREFRIAEARSANADLAHGRAVLAELGRNTPPRPDDRLD